MTEDKDQMPKPKPGAPAGGAKDARAARLAAALKANLGRRKAAVRAAQAPGDNDEDEGGR